MILPPNRRNKASRPLSGPGTPPLLAVLDLGTNNCRLLIAHPTAQERFRVVDSFSRIVRLGEGVGANGLLSDAALDRTVAALKVCAGHIARHRVTHVWAIATQAARQAANTEILIARARAEAGIDLSVISAAEEADLAALGCAPLIGRKYTGALIYDIGGGSTEIVRLVRNAGQPGFQQKMAVSLPIGVVTLAEAHGAGGQGCGGFERMRSEVAARLAPLVQPDFDPQSEHLLGTSGTVTTLAAVALDLPRYNRARVDASWHKTQALMAVADRVAQMDTKTLAQIGPIGPERADLMLAGSAIFAAICDAWPAAMVRVADRGLREGMLRRMRQQLMEQAS